MILIATVQIAMECETHESQAENKEIFEFTLI